MTNAVAIWTSVIPAPAASVPRASAASSCGVYLTGTPLVAGALYAGLLLAAMRAQMPSCHAGPMGLRCLIVDDSPGFIQAADALLAGVHQVLELLVQRTLET